jgi:hypothetical protein
MQSCRTSLAQPHCRYSYIRAGGRAEKPKKLVRSLSKSNRTVTEKETLHVHRTSYGVVTCQQAVATRLEYSCDPVRSSICFYIGHPHLLCRHRQSVGGRSHSDLKARPADDFHASPKCEPCGASMLAYLSGLSIPCSQSVG